MNKISSYIEFIDCYACGKRITFDVNMKDYLRKIFSESATCSEIEDESMRYENNLFKSLNLSQDDTKYIHVDEDMVSIIFPLKFDIEIWIGGKEFMLDKLDEGEEDALFEKIYKFFDEIIRGGFKMSGNANVSSHRFKGQYCGEIEFYKDISNDDEAKEAVRWLIDFKKRFRF